MPEPARDRILLLGCLACVAGCVDNQNIPTPPFASDAQTIVIAQECGDGLWGYAESVDRWAPPPAVCPTGGRSFSLSYPAPPEALGLPRGVLEPAHCEHDPPTVSECCIGRALPANPSGVHVWSGKAWTALDGPSERLAAYRYLVPCPCIDFEVSFLPLVGVGDAYLAPLADHRVALVEAHRRDGRETMHLRSFDPRELDQDASRLGPVLAQWEGPNPSTSIGTLDPSEVYATQGTRLMRASLSSSATTSTEEHPLLAPEDEPGIDVIRAIDGDDGDEIFAVVGRHADAPLIWSNGAWRLVPKQGGPSVSCLERRDMRDGQEPGAVSFDGEAYVMPKESEWAKFGLTPLTAPHGFWRYRPGEVARWFTWPLGGGECVTGLGTDDRGPVVGTTARRFLRWRDDALEEIPIFDQPEGTILFEIKSVAPFRSGFVFGGSGGMFGHQSEGLICELMAFGSPKLTQLIVMDDVIVATGEPETDGEDVTLIVIRPDAP